MLPQYRILRWTPRILAILFTLFITLFALDVFAAGYAWSELLLALFMHLIPTFALLIALAVAWRWPLYGGFLFLANTVGYILKYNMLSHPIAALIIAGPPILIGGLFILDGLLQRRHIQTTRLG